MFESVEEQTFCKQRKLGDLIRYIVEAEAIIIASTFGLDEKEQTEQYVDAFLNPTFTKKMKFYIHRFVHNLNEWSYQEKIWFEDKKLFEKIKKLVEAGHELYTFMESPDHNSKKVIDRLNLFGELRSRGVYVSFKINYSKEYDLFYLDHKYYDLQNMIADKQEYLNKKQNEKF